MKRLSFIFCLGLLLLSSCSGISQKQKEQMQTNLYLSLSDAFLPQDAFTAIAPTIELSSIEEGGTMGWDCAFHGSFSCSFDDRDSHVSMSGVVGFSEDGRVLTLSNGRLAIFFPSILVNSQRVDSDTSIYNLPCFSR